MHEMEMMAGPTISGIPLVDFLMMASGVLYLLCAFLVWRPYRREKNELLGALFAFFVYQAISMVAMGYGMYTMNMFYENLALLAVLVGSAYMLKFPLSSFSRGVRQMLFGLVLVAVLGTFAWLMMLPETPDKGMFVMNFTLWYDILVNGVVVGFFMIYAGMRAANYGYRVKAIGGGAGVASCCVVANGAMLAGAMLTSSVFQFFAPILIIGAIVFGRTAQNNRPV